MDDAWVIQQPAYKQAFLDHINSIDPAIKFTVEGAQRNEAIPFLDTLITPQSDNSLSITVYHKPTHTDQYLQWDSHHSLSAKYSVIGTLTNSAKTVCTGPELLQRELQHLGRLWLNVNTPPGPLIGYKVSFLNSNQEDSSNNNLQDTSNNPTSNRDQQPQPGDNTNNSQAKNNLNTSTERTTISRPKSTVGYVVIPYTQGLAESFKNTCGKYGIQTYFKGNTTIKQVLRRPKDQVPKNKKSGVIYGFQCNHIACGEEYIGKTSRTLGERYMEHLKQASPIHAHIQQTGHNNTDPSFNIIGREDQGLARTIKESMYIRVNNPTLNHNIGKYNLSHTWDRVLFNTPGLKLVSSQQPSAKR